MIVMKGYFQIVLLVSLIWTFECSNKWWKKYTKSKTGCPCWFDLTNSATHKCACCKGNGIQCGYPMHNYCQKDSRNPLFRKGCPGIPSKKYTLSTTGYPCHYNPSDYSCAWCALGSQQCGKAGTFANNYLKKNPGKLNSCLPLSYNDLSKNEKKARILCIGQAQDCRNSENECNVNADCVNTGKRVKIASRNFWSVHRCKCNPGYVGNGIVCADESTGIVKRGQGIDLTTKLTSDVYEQYNLTTSVDVANNDDFMDSLDHMLNGGTCSGCNNEVVTCPA